jgi:hypothetical protein
LAKNNNITFKKGNKVIGGIDIITNYISGANYMPLVFFNNVGIVKAYMTSGFLYKTFIVYLKNSQVHYLIMFNDYSYDLYFDTKQTEDSLTLSIAKSFRRKSTVSNNTLKDGELGKVTGAYFKEINFAKLIVVQSARVTNELHFIYTKELLKGISEQNLKNNDKVEITYLKNGYNELIPKSIKKVK